MSQLRSTEPLHTDLVGVFKTNFSANTLEKLLKMTTARAFPEIAGPGAHHQDSKLSTHNVLSVWPYCPHHPKFEMFLLEKVIELLYFFFCQN